MFAREYLQERKLPITSSQLTKYYRQNDHGEIVLLDKYAKLTRPLNEQEIDFPIQTTSYEFIPFHEGIRYYEVGGFMRNNYLYKLIIYNWYGISDTPLLNIQLNSYDEQGKLLDAVLLDSQYSYEDVSCFIRFSVNKNLTINLKHYVTYYYDDVHEYGDEAGLIKDPKPEFYKGEQYKINNGKFKLIYSKMAKKFEWQQ